MTRTQLSVIWSVRRLKAKLNVYSPSGQQVIRPEKEARELVERYGWTYLPPGMAPDRPDSN